MCFPPLRAYNFAPHTFCPQKFAPLPHILPSFFPHSWTINNAFFPFDIEGKVGQCAGKVKLSSAIFLTPPQSSFPYREFAFVTWCCVRHQTLFNGLPVYPFYSSTPNGAVISSCLCASNAVSLGIPKETAQRFAAMCASS